MILVHSQFLGMCLNMIFFGELFTSGQNLKCIMYLVKVLQNCHDLMIKETEGRFTRCSNISARPRSLIGMIDGLLEQELHDSMKYWAEHGRFPSLVKVSSATISSSWTKQGIQSSCLSQIWMTNNPNIFKIGPCIMII